MDELFLLFSGLGFLGGLTRALYGLIKALGRGEKIRPGLFTITLIASVIIGAALGAFFDIDYHIAAVAGYTGTDILDSIRKNSMSSAVTLNK